ncbi:MAG TPA: Pls/PosA family non-ribosomal peptide synthetase [Xanthobacteraceae bacterium]|nr:Pls/PosA family non-ribosomal peptide synthetase [Xanthobacteraceae bacterium]
MCSVNTATVVKRVPGVQPPRFGLLHEYFEYQAALRPRHPVLECDGERWTYRQLNRVSNRIGRWLRRHGAQPGVLVGICLPKSPRLYAVMLGVLKSGAGYVPIDPTLPQGRIQSIVSDARIKIVVSITEKIGEPLSFGGSTRVLYLSPAMTEVKGYSRAMLDAAETGAVPTDACYVIYTSGSTGRPKGVVVEHRNATNFVEALQTVYRIDRTARVYQGFSVAFDASVEEIWTAFSRGGTLVVPPDYVAKSPLDASDFLTRNKISVFSTVPTFLEMIDDDLPTVRLLVVGGEPCPPELVARWAPGRRMLNTYGPTEATVVATAAECLPEEPVTIGKPLPGYTALVLDDACKPVAAGEIGELYIGGNGIARGYLNLPELTAECFVVNPSQDPEGCDTRMFRTHDIVRVMPDGAFQFQGRNDQQVKIRGFRVELSEIEAVLLEEPSVKAAAVNVIRHGEMLELAAYIVPKRDLNQHDRRNIVDLLQKRVPDYMVPRYLDVLCELPTMLSGKVDRKLLPQPRTLLTNEQRQSVPPGTQSEKTIVEIFERFFGVSPIFASDDFFRDLRGHSQLAARVVTALRAKFGTPRISVRDLYTHRTAIHLAKHLESMQVVEPTAVDAGTPISDLKPGGESRPVGIIGRWACAAAQALVILALYAIVATPLLYLMFMGLDVYEGRVEWWRAAENGSTLALGIWPFWLATSIAVKWLVIGRYKPGRYRVWGLYYLRWWIVDRFQSISWCGMFVGTPLMSLYYAAMGAKVGANCTICTPYCAAFDLISIGRSSSIGSDTHLLGYRVEDGYLVLDRLEIGKECFVGVHCNLGLNVVMGDRACLDDMSMLPDGAVVASGESRRGSPAVRGAVRLPTVVSHSVPRWRRIVFGTLHLVLIYVMGYLLMLAAVPGVGLAVYGATHSGETSAWIAIMAAVPATCLSWLLIVLYVKCVFIGSIRPGTYALASGTYLRIWFLRYLLDNTRHLLTPIYATMVMPGLLRLLGAKIGRGVEISTVMHVMPDLLEVGDSSFLADACIVGGFRINRGWIELMPNKIGSRTFIGNSALAPSGHPVGNNSLIGVMSVPPANERHPRDGTRWLGSPSFELPNTGAPACTAHIDERRTYHPPVWLILLRGVMEILRMLLPALILGGLLLAFFIAMRTLHDSLPLVEVFLVAPAVILVLSLAAVFAAAATKWIFMGRFHPTIKPLWSFYVWRNEVLNAVYECLAAHAMSPLLGTPFVAPCLRLMGCKVGRWTYVHTTLFSEFDLVRIGDFAALNLGVTIQTHLFEDRVMKADVLDIGKNCSIGNMSIVLYGVTMERGSCLGPMSLLMKGETVSASTRWHGIPTEQIRPDAEAEAQSTPLVRVA